jgi:tetratricopeptide (TPR) repeat protein
MLADLDGLSEALAQLLEDGDQRRAEQLAANAWRLWLMAGDPERGRAFLKDLLDAPATEPSRERSLALYGDGLLAFHLSAVRDLEARSSAALAIARGLNDHEAQALALLGLSRAAFQDGDHELARSLAVEARSYAVGLAPAMGQAPLHMHAQATRCLGEFDEAAGLFEDSIALNRQVGDVGMAAVEFHNLGHLEIHRGNIDEAERYFEECAALAPGDDVYGVAMGELNRAVVSFARGDKSTAKALSDRAHAVIEEHSIELAPDDQAELDRLDVQLYGDLQGPVT